MNLKMIHHTVRQAWGIEGVGGRDGGEIEGDVWSGKSNGEGIHQDTGWDVNGEKGEKTDDHAALTRASPSSSWWSRGCRSLWVMWLLLAEPWKCMALNLKKEYSSSSLSSASSSES